MCPDSRATQPLEARLSDPFPAFLELLSDDPTAFDRACAQFEDFVAQYLEIRPLRSLAGESASFRSGATEEILLHFQLDRANLLRSYPRDSEGAFATWFRARAESLAYERKRRLRSSSAAAGSPSVGATGDGDSGPIQPFATVVALPGASVAATVYTVPARLLGPEVNSAGSLADVLGLRAYRAVRDVRDECWRMVNTLSGRGAEDRDPRTHSFLTHLLDDPVIAMVRSPLSAVALAELLVTATFEAVTAQARSGEEVLLILIGGSAAGASVAVVLWFVNNVAGPFVKGASEALGGEFMRNLIAHLSQREKTPGEEE